MLSRGETSYPRNVFHTVWTLAKNQVAKAGSDVAGDGGRAPELGHPCTPLALWVNLNPMPGPRGTRSCLDPLICSFSQCGHTDRISVLCVILASRKPGLFGWAAPTLRSNSQHLVRKPQGRGNGIHVSFGGASHLREFDTQHCPPSNLATRIFNCTHSADTKTPTQNKRVPAPLQL